MGLWKTIVHALIRVTLGEALTSWGVGALLAGWVLGSVESIANLPTPFKEVCIAGVFLLGMALVRGVWYWARLKLRTRGSSAHSVINITIGDKRYAQPTPAGGVRFLKPVRAETAERLRHATIPVHDFAEARDGIINMIHFEECTLVGPAILLFQLSILDSCTFMVPNGNIDGILWEVRPEQSDILVGPTPTWNCRFTRCHFRLVAFASDPIFIDRLRSLISAGRVIERESRPAAGTS